MLKVLIKCFQAPTLKVLQAQAQALPNMLISYGFIIRERQNILSNLPIVKNNCKDTYKYEKLYRQHITKDVKSILYMPVQVYTKVCLPGKFVILYSSITLTK